MPPLPGEERVLTLYADVHYYFAAPAPHPHQHRFDRDSYLYIYHDPAQQKARIEIANNPGTPELDAFCGSLDTIHLRNNDRFPTRCTLTVDGLHPQGPSAGGSPTTGQGADGSDWRLAYTSPHDGSKTFLRLHTVDIYFWTLNDVKVFLTTALRLLSPNQLDIMPMTTPAPSVSSVVQQLEHVAVSDPSYRNSQMRTPGMESHNVSPIPPPPPPQPAHGSLSVSTGVVANTKAHGQSEPVSPLEDHPPAQAPPSTKPQEVPQNYTPLAYNPAAPAAPEPVKLREKTPPPPDSAAGTGLAAASTMDSGVPSFGGPPPGAQATSLEYGYNHPGAVQQQQQQPYNPSAAYMGSPQHGRIPSQHEAHANPATSGGLSFGPPPPTTTGPASAPGITADRPGSMTFAGHPQDPNMHLYRQQSFPHQPPVTTGPGPYNPGQPTAGAAAPPPGSIGGYPQYSYGQQQPQHQQAHANPYDIHNQVYRPEGDAAATYKPAQQPAGGKTGKITENAMRVEKGVNKFLRKLEKKL